MEIRALRPDDDRASFRCGDPDLDAFFQKFAAQNQFRLYVGVSYVAAEGRRILGFATVAPGHVEIDRLPQTERRGLPRYPLPILRLARLATDRTAQGQGVGLTLLRFVMRLRLRMVREVGCVGVLVDAEPDAVSFYERFGFFPLEALEGESDARPQPRLLFLPTRVIAEAEGGDD